MPKELLYSIFHPLGEAEDYLAAVSRDSANARIIANFATYAMLHFEHHTMCDEGIHGLATFIHRSALHRQRDSKASFS